MALQIPALLFVLFSSVTYGKRSQNEEIMSLELDKQAFGEEVANMTQVLQLADADAILIEWTNLHPSSKKVCFYYGLPEKSRNWKSIVNVGINKIPLAFMESTTASIKMIKTDELFFEYGYSLEDKSATECPSNPKLLPITGVSHPGSQDALTQTTFRYKRLSQVAVALDWMPLVVLKANGQLMADGMDVYQGVQIALRNEAPLDCQVVRNDMNAWLTDLKSSHSIRWNSFMGNIERFRCKETVIELKCTAADSASYDNWGITPPPLDDSFVAKFDASDSMRELCNFDSDSSPSHYSPLLYITVVGDGSDLFPYKLSINRRTPGEFSCSEKCVSVVPGSQHDESSSEDHKSPAAEVHASNKKDMSLSTTVGNSFAAKHNVVVCTLSTVVMQFFIALL